MVQEKWVEASQWCEVALHRIFDKSGDLNYAKLGRYISGLLRASQSLINMWNRRIIHCAIQVADYGKAIEVYGDMSEPGKQSPITLFLMFKVALRTSNHQLGKDSLIYRPTVTN